MSDQDKIDADTRKLLVQKTAEQDRAMERLAEQIMSAHPLVGHHIMQARTLSDLPFDAQAIVLAAAKVGLIECMTRKMAAGLPEEST